MQRTCRQSGKTFEVSDADLAFLDKMAPVIGAKKFDLPLPNLCPEERLRNRLVFRNELSLHHRTCDMTGKKIISMYSEDAPFPVYDWREWSKDSWSALDYGRNFDFSRSFFEQFEELRNDVPQLSLIFLNNVNCDFCNVVGNCKNCYLCSGSIECEDCYYGNPFVCKDSIDSLVLRDSQLCLQCIDSSNLYNCQYCQDCHNSQDLQYCYNVRSCKNCFACVNLNRKQYCILNQQYSKEDYERIVSSFDHSTVWVKLEELKRTLPHRSYVGVNNENVRGDYITNSKDCDECYHCEQCQDCRYCFQMMKCKDCMDVCNAEYGELCYEISALYGNVHRVILSAFVWDGVSDCIYCSHCTKNVKNCFGCIGLRQAQYCIFNKQYTKEEYEDLVPKIIGHMNETGEWGKFFPMSLSPFAYNETTAYQYLPMSKEDVLRNGWRWSDDIGAENKENVDGLTCEVTGKPFRIIPQERSYYEKRSLDLPKRAPAQRHLDRIMRRNPMKLWERECAKCGCMVSTSYAPKRPEMVYCEGCFSQEIY